MYQYKIPVVGESLNCRLQLVFDGRAAAMTQQRVVLEIGMGTDIRGGDSTKAAVRALKNALRRNALTITSALGLGSDAMFVKVMIGVPKPESVDRDAILAVLPHGTGSVSVEEGGLVVEHESREDCTILAHAAAIVYVTPPAAGP